MSIFTSLLHLIIRPVLFDVHILLLACPVTLAHKLWLSLMPDKFFFDQFLPFCNADLIAHPDTLAHMQCLVIQYAW
jgi:hypothetical protein